MPAHLRPSAPTAPAALLCGDPARALAIAQRILVKPRMSNHHRGLWGYHGETSSGSALTVQATGIGGPSAAIVIGELAELGLERAIRIGTCATLHGSEAPHAGSKLVVDRALACDGTSVALGAEAGAAIAPDAELTAGLRAGPAITAAVVQCRDVPPASEDLQLETEETETLPFPPTVGDLQTAAVLMATATRGIRCAAGLVVGTAGGRRLEDEPLESRLLELASTAAVVLETAVNHLAQLEV